MRVVEIGRKKVELYDAIEELPIKRFHKYNKMLLIDSGIGGTFEDAHTHIVRAITYINHKQSVEAVTELTNLRQNLIMMQEGVTPKVMAFALLVKSINGKECADITDKGIEATIEQLGDATIKEIATSMDEVKKKIDFELQTYFPNTFEDASQKEFYDVLKKRTNAILEQIQESNEEKAQEEKELTDKLLTFNTPIAFSGKNNAEIAHDKNYEKMCAVIAQYLHVNPKDYTVLEFYNAFEYVQEMLKAKEKALKSRTKR